MSEPLALLVATHLALCPSCRKHVSQYEAVGGELLEDVEPQVLALGSLDQVMAQLDKPLPEPSMAPERPPQAVIEGLVLPQPLRGYAEEAAGGLKWNRRGGVSEAALLPDNQAFRTSLMRIKPDTVIPEHTHLGSEYTLVLAGGFSDEKGHYLRGDVALADPSVQHRPVADPGEDCICLAVTDAPLQLTGRFGRLLNPFLHR